MLRVAVPNFYKWIVSTVVGHLQHGPSSDVWAKYPCRKNINATTAAGGIKQVNTIYYLMYQFLMSDSWVQIFQHFTCLECSNTIVNLKLEESLKSHKSKLIHRAHAFDNLFEQNIFNCSLKCVFLNSLCICKPCMPYFWD